MTVSRTWKSDVFYRTRLLLTRILPGGAYCSSRDDDQRHIFKTPGGDKMADDFCRVNFLGRSAVS
jgi:hypothetical protein